MSRRTASTTCTVLAAAGPCRSCLSRQPPHCTPLFLELESITHNVASFISKTLGRGVTRSKRRAMEWCRKAAENGHADACVRLATCLYLGQPYAREVGHVREADAAVTSDGVMEGHDVPRDAFISVVHWLLKGCTAGERITNPLDDLEGGGLHSSTFRFNLSAFCGIGAAFRGCSGDVQGVSGGIAGCEGCILCQKRLNLS